MVCALNKICLFWLRYNCSVQESDNDIFIVYQAKTIQVLSLSPPRQTIKVSLLKNATVRKLLNLVQSL